MQRRWTRAPLQGCKENVRLEPVAATAALFPEVTPRSAQRHPAKPLGILANRQKIPLWRRRNEKVRGHHPRCNPQQPAAIASAIGNPNLRMAKSQKKTGSVKTFSDLRMRKILKWLPLPTASVFQT